MLGFAVARKIERVKTTCLAEQAGHNQLMLENEPPTSTSGKFLENQITTRRKFIKLR